MEGFPITTSVLAAFSIAASAYQALNERWVRASNRVGGFVPQSLLMMSVQRLGRLDILLRGLEDERSAEMASGGGNQIVDFGAEYQGTLSELWVGAAYEIARLLKERKLVPASGKFSDLEHDLRILRIPLEKHEIAAHNKLPPNLHLRKLPEKDGDTPYVYNKTDPKRGHIMPSGLSSDGAYMWCAIDSAAATSRWIGRRDLSNRFLSMFAPEDEGSAVGAVEAEPGTTL